MTAPKPAPAQDSFARVLGWAGLIVAVGTLGVGIWQDKIAATALADATEHVTVTVTHMPNTVPLETHVNFGPLSVPALLEDWDVTVTNTSMSTPVNIVKEWVSIAAPKNGGEDPVYNTLSMASGDVFQADKLAEPVFPIELSPSKPVHFRFTTSTPKDSKSFAFVNFKSSRDKTYYGAEEGKVIPPELPKAGSTSSANHP